MCYRSFVKEIENALEIAKLDYFSPRSEGVLIKMSPEEKEIRMKQIFKSNVRNIKDTDVIIAVIDNYDTGTVWEMGFSYGVDVPIFTISNNDYGLNVMVGQSVEIHNTKINNLIINLLEYEDGEPMTIFDELTKDVT